ncbi:hypothetical protein VCHENC03_2117B, partial [Vibrio sp. HENC-03]
YKNKAI